MRAPVVGGKVAGGYLMPVAEMRACTVGETGGCKPRRERVSSAPLTRLFRYPDFTW